MSEAVVLCEGFHDRAFWAGWLLRLGCTDPGLLPDGTRRLVLDPWNKIVADGDGEGICLVAHGWLVCPPRL